MKIFLGGAVAAIGIFAVSAAYAAPTIGLNVTASAMQTKLLTNVNNTEAQCGPYGKEHKCTAIWSRGTRECKCVGK